MAAAGSAVLIIRVWFEEESARPLRAHVRRTTDVSSGFDDGVTLTQVDTVCESVREWLTDGLAEHARS
jgi:hypothetical protein